MEKQFLSTYNPAWSVWFYHPQKLYVGSFGIYSLSKSTLKWKQVDELLLVNIRSIRGTAPNNVWAVGDKGFVSHFNGRQWKQILPPSTPFNIYYGVACKENITVAVGVRGSKALVTVIKK